jgi:hypothetical protein
MTARTPVHGLQVATVLKDFVDQRVRPGTGLEADASIFDGFLGTPLVLHRSHSRHHALLQPPSMSV